MSDPAPEITAVTGELPPIYTLTVEEARRGYADYLAIERDIATVDRVRTDTAAGPRGDVPVRIYEPRGTGPHPLVVWMHGGGFVLGDAESYDPVCRVLCDELGAVVVAMDYRRAPEHPFPAAVIDCHAATEWAVAQADRFDADRDFVVVAGDSAGGNLAAAVSLLARDKGTVDIDHQVLIYPTTTFRYEFDTEGETDDDLFLTERDLEWSWDLYLESELDGMNPYASPLRARSLSDLPSATVITCTHDPLQDEGIEYASRLADAGVDVTHTNYDDMVHSFVTLLAEPRIEQAWDAVDVIRDDLRSRHDG